MRLTGNSFIRGILSRAADRAAAAKRTAASVAAHAAAAAARPHITFASRWAAARVAELRFVARAVAAFAHPSLRRISTRIHRDHFRRNPSIRAFRYSWCRLRMNAAGNHPLLSFCIAMAIFAAGTLAASALLPPAGGQKFFAEVKHGDFQDVAVGLLAAQAALIALVFPLIIALIGVLFDLRTTSGARLNIFLKETEALVVGGSSLCLSALLSIQLLFFPYLPAAICAVVLLFDVFWFVLNVGLLAFFLFKTLDFVRPERRGVLYRRFIVNVVWRAELLRLITYNRLAGAVEYGYLPATPRDLENAPKVIVSSMLLDSIPAAVSVHLGESSNLADVHLPVLRVIAEKWLKAARPQPRGASLVWLVFEPVPMRTYEGETVLARSPADLPLSPLERFLIRLAFRFQNASAERTPPDTSALLKDTSLTLYLLLMQAEFRNSPLRSTRRSICMFFSSRLLKSPATPPRMIPSTSRKSSRSHSARSAIPGRASTSTCSSAPSLA
jgi:hypothetical protein